MLSLLWTVRLLNFITKKKDYYIDMHAMGIKCGWTQAYMICFTTASLLWRALNSLGAGCVPPRSLRGYPIWAQRRHGAATTSVAQKSHG